MGNNQSYPRQGGEKVKDYLRRKFKGKGNVDDLVLIAISEEQKLIEKERRKKSILRRLNSRRRFEDENEAAEYNVLDLQSLADDGDNEYTSPTSPLSTDSVDYEDWVSFPDTTPLLKPTATPLTYSQLSPVSSSVIPQVPISVSTSVVPPSTTPVLPPGLTPGVNSATTPEALSDATSGLLQGDRDIKNRVVSCSNTPRRFLSSGSSTIYKFQTPQKFDWDMKSVNSSGVRSLSRGKEAPWTDKDYGTETWLDDTREDESRKDKVKTLNDTFSDHLDAKSASEECAKTPTESYVNIIVDKPNLMYAKPLFVAENIVKCADNPAEKCADDFVEKYANNTVKIIAENPFEKCADIPYEKCIDSPSKKCADNTVEMCADNYVKKGTENPAEMRADKLTEQCADIPVVSCADTPDDMCADNPAEKCVEICAETPAEKCADNLVEKCANNLIEKCAETPAEKCADNLVEKCADNLVEKCADNLVEKCADNGVEKCADNGVEKCTENPAEKLADKLTEKCADIPVENCAENATEKCADIPIEKYIYKHTENCVDNPVEKCTKDAIKSVGNKDKITPEDSKPCHENKNTKEQSTDEDLDADSRKENKTSMNDKNAGDISTNPAVHTTKCESPDISALNNSDIRGLVEKMLLEGKITAGGEHTGNVYSFDRTTHPNYDPYGLSRSHIPETDPRQTHCFNCASNGLHPNVQRTHGMLPPHVLQTCPMHFPYGKPNAMDEHSKMCGYSNALQRADELASQQKRVTHEIPISIVLDITTKHSHPSNPITYSYESTQPNGQTTSNSGSVNHCEPQIKREAVRGPNNNTDAFSESSGNPIVNNRRILEDSVQKNESGYWSTGPTSSSFDNIPVKPAKADTSTNSYPYIGNTPLKPSDNSCVAMDDTQTKPAANSCDAIENTPNKLAANSYVSIDNTPIKPVANSYASIDDTPIKPAANSYASIDNTPIKPAANSYASIDDTPIKAAANSYASIDNTPIKPAANSYASIDDTPIKPASNSYASVDNTPIKLAANSYASVDNTPIKPAANSYTSIDNTPIKPAANSYASVDNTPIKPAANSYASVDNTPIKPAANSYASVDNTPIKPAANSYASVDNTPIKPAANSYASVDNTPIEPAANSYASVDNTPIKPAANSYASVDNTPIKPAANSYASIDNTPIKPAANSYASIDDTPIKPAANSYASVDNTQIKPAANSYASIDNTPIKPAANSYASIDDTPIKPAANSYASVDSTPIKPAANSYSSIDNAPIKPPTIGHSSDDYTIFKSTKVNESETEKKKPASFFLDLGQLTSGSKADGNINVKKLEQKEREEMPNQSSTISKERGNNTTAAAFFVSFGGEPSAEENGTENNKFKKRVTNDKGSDNVPIDKNAAKPAKADTTTSDKTSDGNPSKPAANSYATTEDNPIKPPAISYASIDDTPIKPAFNSFAAIENTPIKPAAVSYSAIENTPIKPGGENPFESEKPAAGAFFVSFGPSSNESKGFKFDKNTKHKTAYGSVEHNKQAKAANAESKKKLDAITTKVDSWKANDSEENTEKTYVRPQRLVRKVAQYGSVAHNKSIKENNAQRKEVIDNMKTKVDSWKIPDETCDEKPAQYGSVAHNQQIKENNAKRKQKIEGIRTTLDTWKTKDPNYTYSTGYGSVQHHNRIKENNAKRKMRLGKIHSTLDTWNRVNPGSKYSIQNKDEWAPVLDHMKFGTAAHYHQIKGTNAQRNKRLSQIKSNLNTWNKPNPGSKYSLKRKDEWEPVYDQRKYGSVAHYHQVKETQPENRYNIKKAGTKLNTWQTKSKMKLLPGSKHNNYESHNTNQDTTAPLNSQRGNHSNSEKGQLVRNDHFEPQERSLEDNQRSIDKYESQDRSMGNRSTELNKYEYQENSFTKKPREEDQYEAEVEARRNKPLHELDDYEALLKLKERKKRDIDFTESKPILSTQEKSDSGYLGPRFHSVPRNDAFRIPEPIDKHYSADIRAIERRHQMRKRQSAANKQNYFERQPSPVYDDNNHLTSWSRHHTDDIVRANRSAIPVRKGSSANSNYMAQARTPRPSQY